MYTNRERVLLGLTFEGLFAVPSILVSTASNSYLGKVFSWYQPTTAAGAALDGVCNAIGIASLPIGLGDFLQKYAPKGTNQIFEAVAWVGIPLGLSMLRGNDLTHAALQTLPSVAVQWIALRILFP